jgi:hypothetical protein
LLKRRQKNIRSTDVVKNKVGGGASAPTGQSIGIVAHRIVSWSDIELMRGIEVSEGGHRGYCKGCGRLRPTQHVFFRENISYFFGRQYRELSAYLCIRCATLMFASFEGRTLVLTWWGLIGALLGPYHLLYNLLEYLTALSRFSLRQR